MIGMSTPGTDLASLCDVSQRPDNHNVAAVEAAMCLMQAFAASGRDVVAQ